jgi:hypothetical protein
VSRAVVEHDVDLRRLRAQAELQRPRRVERDDLAVGEEGHARAQLVGLVHVMRREEDRRPALGQSDRRLAQVARGLRVEAARRLVHEQHARGVQQRSREQQALAHARREGLDLALGDVAQAHLLEHLGGPALRQAVERAEQLDVLLRRRALIDVRRLGDQVDLAADRLELARDLVAEDTGMPARGLRAAREDADHRGLAGPVVAEQPEDLARVRLEAHAIQRTDVAVVLGQILDLHGIRRRRRGAIAGPVVGVGSQHALGGGMPRPHTSTRGRSVRKNTLQLAEFRSFGDRLRRMLDGPPGDGTNTGPGVIRNKGRNTCRMPFHGRWPSPPA